MSNKNQMLADSINTDSHNETDTTSITSGCSVNLKTEQQISQKIYTERWIESQTDCAD